LGAPAGVSVSADILAIDNFVDELESRLTAARAGYLDNLSAGAVALASGVDLTSIHGAALTETVNGYLAAAFVKLFDVVTPVLVASDVMRGTDSAALAATALTDVTWTDARAGYLDELAAANLPADLDAVLADTNMLQTDWVNGGRLDLLLDACALEATVAALNNISTAQVNTECDNALSDYDSPTNAEMVAAFTEIKGATWAAGTDTLEHIRDKETDIETDTNELQTDWTNGGRLDLLLDAIPTTAMRGTDGANTVVPDAAGVAATPTEVATALTDIHLDHLLAVNYDPASKPGVATALLNELVENDGGVSRYTANALEQAPSGGTNPNVLIDTTLASVTSQTVVVLTAGSNDDDAYKDQAVVVYDASDSDYPSVRKCSAYVGATKTLTLDSAPDFTIVTGDGAKVFVTAPGTSAPTAAQNADAVWDELKAAHTIADSFGDYLDDEITSRNATTPPTVGAIRTEMEGAGSKLLAIEGYTDKIDDGTDGLTAIKAEVEGLAGAAMRGTDSANTVVPDAAGVAPTAAEIKTELEQAGSSLAQILTDTGTTLDTHLTDIKGATFAGATDSLEAIRDRGDAAWTTGSGGSAADIADAVWDEATSGHTGAGSFGAKNQNQVPSETLNDYKATGFNTVVPDVAGTAAGLHTTTDGKIDTVDANVDAILADTNELQTDWGNGGRLDLILDAIAADTTTDIPALIAALNDLSSAEANAACDTALTDYDPPTRAEATTDKDAIITEVNANETKIDTIDTVVDAIKAKTDNLPSGIAKNVALPKFSIFMVETSDHVTGATGKTVTGTISKDGGSVVSLTNAITEVAGGLYVIASGLTQAEMNADVIDLIFSATGCDDRVYNIHTS
ncbi:MAG: hypothetical protein U9Q68_04435, partial [Euryarchaeota archaeon]|nr:hypothetical protein [Euryarchaeota archaeon]